MYNTHFLQYFFFLFIILYAMQRIHNSGNTNLVCTLKRKRNNDIKISTNYDNVIDLMKLG